MNIKAVVTNDNSLTFYVSEINEHYHSLNGALSESQHVFIDAGLKSLYESNHAIEEIRIFEAGFGTGLNAYLSLLFAIEKKIKIEYTGVELYPLKESDCLKLNYEDFYPQTQRSLFQELHRAAWGRIKQIDQHFKLMKLNKDLTSHLLPDNSYHVVFFDAFSPYTQPEMWTEKIFSQIFRSIIKDGIFVTYSSNGELRRKLERCGFQVEKLKGPPGKRHMLRAFKNNS